MTSEKRRMPIESSIVQLEGAYEGWWFKYRTNPPLGLWVDALSAVQALDVDDVRTVSTGIKGMIDAIGITLLDWNFVDEEGEDLPCDEVGLRKVPVTLLRDMFRDVSTGVEEPPLVKESS